MVPHQQHYGNVAGFDWVPLRARINPAGLIIDPVTQWKINLSRIAVFEQRRDQQTRPEHVFIVDVPRAGIARIFEEERAQHRVTARGRIFGLRVDVRHQRIFQTERAAKVLSQRFVIFPGLARWHTVRARVRRQHTPGEPATIEISRRPLHETTDVVTPVSKARQPEA